MKRLNSEEVSGLDLSVDERLITKLLEQLHRKENKKISVPVFSFREYRHSDFYLIFLRLYAISLIQG